jgi:hypothetical protein
MSSAKRRMVSLPNVGIWRNLVNVHLAAAPLANQNGMEYVPVIDDVDRRLVDCIQQPQQMSKKVFPDPNFYFVQGISHHYAMHIQSVCRQSIRKCILRRTGKKRPWAAQPMRKSQTFDGTSEVGFSRSSTFW